MNIREYYNRSTPDENGAVFLAVTGPNYLRIAEINGELRLSDCNMSTSETTAIDEGQDHNDIIDEWRDSIK